MTRDLTVLHSGPLTREHGSELLAGAFLAAHERDGRLRLVVAGHGPEADDLRARLDGCAVFLDARDGNALASADLFLSCSGFGEGIREAQAAGVPVLAVSAGAAAELVADGRSGLLCPPDPEALGAAVAGLAALPRCRARLARGGLAAARERRPL
jgi:glycosyltransferase involved in cell wall biosynthesis